MPRTMPLYVMYKNFPLHIFFFAVGENNANNGINISQQVSFVHSIKYRFFGIICCYITTVIEWSA